MSVVSTLAQLLHFSGAICSFSPPFHSSILDTFRPGGGGRGDPSFGVILFCLFIQFMGFSKLVYWSGLPFIPPVDRILSELSTVTGPSWVALHGMAHSFTKLCKPLHHDKAVIHKGHY